MKTEYKIKDEFRGDDEHLRQCIKALIEMSDDGILIPHGLGGHARGMLAASYHRLGKRCGAKVALSDDAPKSPTAV